MYNVGLVDVLDENFIKSHKQAFRILTVTSGAFNFVSPEFGTAVHYERSLALTMLNAVVVTPRASRSKQSE